MKHAHSIKLVNFMCLFIDAVRLLLELNLKFLVQFLSQSVITVNSKENFNIRFYVVYFVSNSLI